MDLSAIEDMGLSNAQARIYVALLELGPSKSGDIVNKTKLQSSTVYHVLGQLLDQGLINYIIKGKMKIFSASPPESILVFHDEKRENFEKTIPQLHALYSNTKGNAVVYQGIKGLQVAYNDILKSLKKGDEYYFTQVPRDTIQNKRVRLFFRNFHLKRSEKGIIVHGLAPDDSRKEINEIFSKLKNSNMKFVKNPLPSGITIYKDKVITIDWDEDPTVFVIESKRLYEQYKRFFENEWKNAKK